MLALPEVHKYCIICDDFLLSKHSIQSYHSVLAKHVIKNYIVWRHVHMFVLYIIVLRVEPLLASFEQFRTNQNQYSCHIVVGQ